jgi:hypothetical protein
LGADALAELLAADLHGAGLTRLSLNLNHVAPSGARCLAAALGANSTLKHLSLAGVNNAVGDVGARALAVALGANFNLICLDLDNSCIGDDGGYAALLAALDAHRSLTELNLTWAKTRRSSSVTACGSTGSQRRCPPGPTLRPARASSCLATAPFRRRSQQE